MYKARSNLTTTSPELRMEAWSHSEDKTRLEMDPAHHHRRLAKSRKTGSGNGGFHDMHGQHFLHLPTHDGLAKKVSVLLFPSYMYVCVRAHIRQRAPGPSSYMQACVVAHIRQKLLKSLSRLVHFRLICTSVSVRI